MEINKIYIDLDGVVADFDGGVKDLCHMEPLDQMSATPAQNDALWAAIHKVDGFYGLLKPLPEGERMFQQLYQEYGDKVEILSGIPKPYRRIAHAGQDKINWVHKYLSQRVKINIVYREQKKEYCHGPGDILIDDYLKNIRKWRELGGKGILYVSAKEALNEVHTFREE